MNTNTRQVPKKTLEALLEAAEELQIALEELLEGPTNPLPPKTLALMAHKVDYDE
jgi:hypothetical protein